MTTLTLIDGAEQRTFTEHPIEIARRALLEAAELEDGDWARNFRELASCLPERAPKVGARPSRSPEQEEKWARLMEKSDEAHDAWRRCSTARRETLLLQVLGDERLILRELTSRLNAELGYPEGKDATGRRCPSAVYQGHVRSLVERMFRAGQLERDVDIFNVSHLRYRYHRAADGVHLRRPAAPSGGGGSEGCAPAARQEHDQKGGE